MTNVKPGPTIHNPDKPCPIPIKTPETTSPPALGLLAHPEHTNSKDPMRTRSICVFMIFPFIWICEMALVIFFKEFSSKLLNFVDEFLFLPLKILLFAVQGLFGFEGCTRMSLLRGLPIPLIG